jgi:hypothetical protein
MMSLGKNLSTRLEKTVAYTAFHSEWATWKREEECIIWYSLNRGTIT